MSSANKKYAVGTACFSITDESRRETLGNGEGYRKIAVRMYYPTEGESVQGKTKAAIFSDRKLAALTKAYHIPKSASMSNEADYYENAEPSSGKFPLVFFNHGYNSYIEANTYLCCELASNGYVVASVGHAYEAIENDYEDGSFDLYDKKLNKTIIKPYIPAVLAQTSLLKKKCSPEQAYEGFVAFQEKYAKFMIDRVEYWAQDTLAVLTELRKRYDMIDFSRGVAAAGHSFGGAAAYYLCQFYDEFVCGINIDGGVFGDYSGKMMKKPFYQIFCRENYNVETKPLLDRDAPVYYAVFDKMKHIGFTDAKFFVPMKFLVGELDADTMHSNLTRCHLGFLNRYLKGNENSVIGETNDAVEFTAYD